MDKPIFTVVEEDIQTIARERFGRDLTEEEMRTAVRCFEYGIEWHEVAKIAVEEAMNK